VLVEQGAFKGRKGAGQFLKRSPLQDVPKREPATAGAAR
jgi:hypothetical protein